MLQGPGLITLPDVDIAAEGRGEGDPLVLIHGFGSDRHAWDGIWVSLSRSGYALRYDLRGFGQSLEKTQKSFDHCRDLLGLLDQQKIGQCDLLGVSMGGAIALRFALDHPARVRRLILVSPALSAWEWSEEWRARWRAIVTVAREGDLRTARELWWSHPVFVTTRNIPQAAKLLRASIEAYSGCHWAEKTREEQVLPDVDRLHLLKPPTLLITGACDVPDFRVIADLIEGAAPSVRRKDYPGVGHLVHIERPTDFVQDVVGFLRS